MYEALKNIGIGISLILLILIISLIYINLRDRWIKKRIEQDSLERRY